MATKYNLMSQLVFKFPFKTKYYEQDYYVSSNNFTAYRLIESWPNWPDKWVNIFGPKGSGKTHLSNILKKKINSTQILNAEDIENETLSTAVIGPKRLVRLLISNNIFTTNALPNLLFKYLRP